jgi:hypothetical protein
MVTYETVLSWSPEALAEASETIRRAGVAYRRDADSLVTARRATDWAGAAGDTARAASLARETVLDSHGQLADYLSRALDSACDDLAAVQRGLRGLLVEMRDHDYQATSDGSIRDLRQVVIGDESPLGEVDDATTAAWRAGVALQYQWHISSYVAQADDIDAGLAGTLGTARRFAELLARAATGDPSAVKTIKAGVPPTETGSETADGYRLGSPHRPDITFDEDFVYGSESAGPGDYLAAAKWRLMLDGGRVARRDLDDATAAYAHYWDNTGMDFHIDYEEAFAEDSGVRSNVHGELVQNMRAAEEFARSGRTDFSFTGPAHPSQAYPTTENWQKTIGAYHQWSSSDVRVVGDTVHMTVTVHTEDRYNFNRGAADIASAAPDDENGRFTELGWAKPFNTSGSLTREITWKIGDNPDDVLAQLGDPSGLTDWNPGREDRVDSPPARNGDDMNRDTGRARVP